MIININYLKSKKVIIIMLFSLILIPFALYYSSLSYDFIYSLDDEWLIINNNSIRDLSLKGIVYIFFFDTTEIMHYNPLPYLSMAIDYYFLGINPFVYKLHNLLLHIFSGILMFNFITLLIKNRNVAFVVSLIYLIHPLNIESVVWASCRRQTLFYCYFLASMTTYLFFLKNRFKKYNNLLFLLAICFWIMSLLSKTIAIVMPGIFVLLYLHERRNAIKLNVIITQIIIMLPIMFLFLHLNTQANDKNFLLRDFNYSTSDHIIFAGYSYFFYWIKGLFPSHLAVFYPVASENLSQLPTIYYTLFAFSIIIIILMIYHFFKKQNTLFFALAYYTIMIFPVLNRIYYPLSDEPILVADRYFYHSSLGIILYLVLIVNSIPKFKSIKIISACTFVLLFSVLFRLNVVAWEDQITLMENDVRYYPNEEFMYRLAIEYDKKGEISKALNLVEKADKLGTDIWINNVYIYYQQRSKLYVKAKKYDRALNDINIARKKKEFKIPYVDSILLADKKNIEILIKQNQ
jgi:hypothetical protein